jgi:hypothetical protein
MAAGYMFTTTTTATVNVICRYILYQLIVNKIEYLTRGIYVYSIFFDFE